MAFLLWIWVFCFFPQETPPTAKTMNYNILINGVIMIFAVIYYFVKGKHDYVAPVMLVKRDA